MKIIKTILFLFALTGAAFAQTENLGLGAFANQQAPIMVALDAGLAIRQFENPYLMFVLYMAPQQHDQEITVGRENVTLLYQGREYKMPSVKELRQNYQGQLRDADFYRYLGKEGINASWARFYQFFQKWDFFPSNTIDAPTAVDRGSMFGFIGFATTLYFKNPGFKKGDTFILKVKDRTNPGLTGEVEVVLE